MKEQYYGDILSKNDIILIGNQILLFERREIEFEGMKTNLEKVGIEITPRFLDPKKYYEGQNDSEQKIENFKNKIAKGIVSRYDVTGFYVSGYNAEKEENYQNVPISSDEFMMELLAQYGVSDAKECLKEIQREEREETFKKR